MGPRAMAYALSVRAALASFGQLDLFGPFLLQ
jgi:hypothetical protein